MIWDVLNEFGDGVVEGRYRVVDNMVYVVRMDFGNDNVWCRIQSGV
jgi:hypothetical protein